MGSIKEHCCGADKFFDSKTAKKQYRQYLKKGPSRVTASIIDQLSSLPLKDKTMIDIGGGIGALQWWFLENGGNHVTAIDASSGYLEQARIHANDNNWIENSQFVVGDFTEVHQKAERPEIITLDKVVCCYPDFKEILSLTCE